MSILKILSLSFTRIIMVNESFFVLILTVKKVRIIKKLGALSGLKPILEFSWLAYLRSEKSTSIIPEKDMVIFKIDMQSPSWRLKVILSDLIIK